MQKIHKFVIVAFVATVCKYQVGHNMRHISFIFWSLFVKEITVA